MKELPDGKIGVDLCISILRNPHGWSDDVVRSARNFGADLIETYRNMTGALLTGDDIARLRGERG